MTKNGVGLIRVSTGAQAEDDRASIPAQRQIIKEIAVRHQIHVVDVFELADISGAEVAHAPKYHVFLNRLQDPEISCVITREFSRLMRPERFDDYAILQHFVDCGITLYFPADVLDLSNRQARFMAGIRAGVSGLERGDIAERVASAKEVKRRQGQHPCGEHTLARGLGYTKARGWYWDEEELAPVRLLFRLFLDGMQTYEKLSEITGIARSSIKFILSNPVYMGWMVYRQKKDLTVAGYVRPNFERKGYRRNIDRPPNEVIRFQLPLPPLITEPEHGQILEIVENKRRHWSSVRGDAIDRFTYRSFLYCGACSEPIYTWAANPSGRKDFYQCRANFQRYRKVQPAGCMNGHMARHLLEPILDRALHGRLTDAAFLQRIFEAHWFEQRQIEAPSTDELLLRQFDVLQSKRKRVIDLFLDGNISRLEKNERLRDLDSGIEALNQVRPAELPPARFGHEQVVDVVETFDDWGALQTSAKRAILHRLVPEIFVYRKVICGVSLRVGYDFANRPRKVAEVITSPESQLKPATELIYVPFPEGVTV